MLALRRHGERQWQPSASLKFCSRTALFMFMFDNLQSGVPLLYRCSCDTHDHLTSCTSQVPRVSFFFCDLGCNVIQPAAKNADLFLLLDL